MAPGGEAEERAAILAEARGDFGLAKPQAEHVALVAALVRGYETHRRPLLCPADTQPGQGRNGSEA